MFRFNVEFFTLLAQFDGVFIGLVEGFVSRLNFKIELISIVFKEFNWKI